MSNQIERFFDILSKLSNIKFSISLKDPEEDIGEIEKIGREIKDALTHMSSAKFFLLMEIKKEKENLSHNDPILSSFKRNFLNFLEFLLENLTENLFISIYKEVAARIYEEVGNKYWGRKDYEKAMDFYEVALRFSPGKESIMKKLRWLAGETE